MFFENHLMGHRIKDDFLSQITKEDPNNLTFLIRQLDQLRLSSVCVEMDNLGFRKKNENTPQWVLLWDGPKSGVTRRSTGFSCSHCCGRYVISHPIKRGRNHLPSG
jgi:hypothetical protein